MTLPTQEERIQLLEENYAKLIEENKILRDIAIGAGKLSEVVAKSHIIRLNEIYAKRKSA